MFTAPLASAQEQLAAAQRLAALPWVYQPGIGNAPSVFALLDITQGAARRAHCDMMVLQLDIHAATATDADDTAFLGQRQRRLNICTNGASSLRRFVESVLPYAPVTLQQHYALGQMARGHVVPAAMQLQQFDNIVVLPRAYPRPARPWHDGWDVTRREVVALDFCPDAI